MELSIKSITLYAGIILTGLSAGLFYAWAVSIIPGTKKVVDLTYLETMQAINRAILNPRFFLIYFGSLILLITSTVQQYGKGTTFWILLTATLCYAICFGVTAFGNVPLNNELDRISLSQWDAQKLSEFREYYEVKWNFYHTIRTIFSVGAFLTATAAIFTYSRI